MVLWLVSTAFAGIPWEEDQLLDECINPESCIVVLGEVIDAGCRSTAQDSNGIIYREFTASIEVLEGTDSIEAGAVLTLHTSSSDYSEVDEDVGLPGCTQYDPGHPIGEVARYYLGVDTEDGIYALWGSETFFHTEESNPDPEPLCAELENWDADPENEEPDSNGDPVDAESTNSDEPKEGGCSAVSAPATAVLWIASLMAILIRSKN